MLCPPAAYAVASRMIRSLPSIPDRWIGDNVLAHLEEIGYLEKTLQPEVMLFLDIERPSTAMARIEPCMSAVGFGPSCCWVRHLARGHIRPGCRERLTHRPLPSRVEFRLQPSLTVAVCASTPAPFNRCEAAGQPGGIPPAQAPQ